MGLTNEQEKAREEDANVRYLSQNICNKDGDKDFVFISYKSDDWEIVLKEIVYKLVKEYGLNIYFDGDFKDNNPHWTTQFPDNMESDKCKGVLVFLDDKYATSYATLMELMHSQFGCQDALYNFVSKPVVQINLVKALSVIDDESDTGLGKAFYSNGEKKIKNIKAPDEKRLFDDDFLRGCELNVIKKAKKPYQKNEELPKKLCAVVVEEILASIDYNDNFYNGSLDGIVSSIKSVCGETVFHAKKGDDTPVYNVVIKNDEEKNSLRVKAGEIIPKQNSGVRDGFEFEGWFVSNTDEEWDFSKPVHKDIEICAKWKPIMPDSIEGYKYTIFGEYYEAGSREQGKLMFDAFEGLIKRYPGCEEKLTQKTSVARAENVKNANTPEADPTYFRGCKEFEVNGHKYLVGTSYGFKAKIAEIKGMFKICGADLSEFVLNGEPLKSNGSTGKSSGKKSVNNDAIFEYELWGTTHTANKMVDMLNDVFELIAKKYPGKIKNIAESDKITAVARKADLEQGTANASKVKQFKNYKGKEHSVDGEIYLVNAGYNREGCIKQIERMLILCDENPDVFKITKKPEKSTRSVSKSGKEGLGELLN